MNPVFRYTVILFSIFSILFLGAINIGPLSIRNICVIGFLIYIVIHHRDLTLDICGKLYVVYLAVLLICTAITGQLFDVTFYKNFLTNHMTCLVLLLAIPVIICPSGDLKVLFGFFTGVQLFNCVVSILQFYNLRIGWLIGLMINPGAISALNDAEYYLEGADSLLSRSLVFGITSFVVMNGYYLTTFLPIVSRYLMNTGAAIRETFISLVLLALTAVTIFMVQQRMAFLILCCYIVFVLFIRYHKSFIHIFIFSIALIVFLSPYTGINEYEMGRLTMGNVESDSRMNQLLNLQNFFNTDDFIFGADLNDLNLLYSMGHNSLMDVLRRGGFISLIFYLPLFLSLLYKCISTCYVAYKSEGWYSFTLSVACLIFIAYSFTHSTGVQSGAVLFWLMYALMITVWKYEENSLSD